MTVTDPSLVERQYRLLKRKVEVKLQALQQQRVQQLAPSRLYLPIPWQPIVYEQPVTMYKVVAAQGGQLTSVYDSRVVYQLQEWTHARNGCSSGEAWPPLWSCLYAFPTAEQARSAVFPRSSEQQKGARVLCQVTVQGKGYLHPDGRVAVSSIRLDDLLEYVPKGPAERVASVHYDSAGQRSSSRVPAVQLVPELRAAAWDVDDLRHVLQQQLGGLCTFPKAQQKGVVSVHYDAAGQRSSSGRVPAVQLVPELRAAAWDVDDS